MLADTIRITRTTKKNINTAIAPTAQPTIPMRKRMMAAITIAVASAANVFIKVRIAGQSRHRIIHMIRNTIPAIPVERANVKSTGSEKPAQPQAIRLMDETAIRARAMISKIRQRQLVGVGGGAVVVVLVVVLVVVVVVVVDVVDPGHAPTVWDAVIC